MLVFLATLLASSKRGGQHDGPRPAGEAAPAGSPTLAARTAALTAAAAGEVDAHGQLANELREARMMARKDRTHEDVGALVLPTHVATLGRDGAIAMPPDTEYAFIEVGCSDFNTLDQNLLGKHPKAFLLAFEPLLDKYAVLLSRGTERYHGMRKDRAVPLGHHHERAVVLPLAVSEKGGMQNISVSNMAGCSSLVPMNPRMRWAPWCRSRLEKRLVPSISLTAALRLTGSLPVRHLKLDAQGLDFRLLRTVLPSLLHAKVESIEMEVRASDCEPLYVGQAGCLEVLAYMRSIGYENQTSCPWRRVRNLGRQYGVLDAPDGVSVLAAAGGGGVASAGRTGRVDVAVTAVGSARACRRLCVRVRCAFPRRTPAGGCASASRACVYA